MGPRGAASGAPAVEDRPKVVLKERDQSDPRHNKSKPALSHRPSSRSAPRRVHLAKTSVREASPARRVVVQDQQEAEEVEEGAAPGAPVEDQQEHSIEGEGEDTAHNRSRSEPPKLRSKPSRISPTDRPVVLRPALQAYPVTRIDQIGTWALIVRAGGAAGPVNPAPPVAAPEAPAPAEGAAPGAPAAAPAVPVVGGGLHIAHAFAWPKVCTHHQFC